MMCTERESSNQIVVNAVMMVVGQFVNYGKTGKTFSVPGRNRAHGLQDAGRML